MTTPDHGVDLLLRRATEDLRPHVDQLVAGGITRGRAHRRRARIGTAVAAFAVVGVIGAAAAVVPQPGSDPAREVSSADDTTSPATTPSPTPTTSSPATPRSLAVNAHEIPGLVTDLFPGEVTAAAERTGGVMNRGPESQIAHFLWNGTLLSVGAVHDQVSAEDMCAGVVAPDMCTERPDGSTLLIWGATGPALDGSVTGRGASLFLADGWEVFAISYNAADGKGSPVLTPEPPFDHAQLEQLVASDVWFG